MKGITGGLGRAGGIALAGVALTALATACSMDTRDAICMPDEYPTAVIGYAGGGSCVSDGQQPPEGSVRYPEGQVPRHVDDRWDRYWQDHALDADGRLITDPNKVRKG